MESNRATKVHRDRSLRWGPLTAETAIVLGVAAAIFAGAFAMDSIRPISERTSTTVGKDTVEVHQIGKGGIKPGALQPRTIVVPKPTAVPTGPTGLPTPLPKPVKTATAVPTVAPTQPTSGGGLIGGGSGGDKPCTPIPLIKTCPDQKPDKSTSSDDGPAPGTTATPAPDAGSEDSDNIPASAPR